MSGIAWTKGLLIVRDNEDVPPGSCGFCESLTFPLKTCLQPARYEIRGHASYEIGHACVKHTAWMRANQAVVIESVETL